MSDRRTRPTRRDHPTGARSRSAHRRQRRGASRTRRRWLRWPVLAAVLVTVLGLAAIGFALPRVGVGGDRDAVAAPPGDTTAATSSVEPPPTTGPPPTTAPPAPVLRLSGTAPSAGSGEFDFSTKQGKIAGRSGTLRRYRVAVEIGAEEDVEAFGDAVEKLLSDERSWIGGGQLRLQRVPDQAGHDFTVYLATAQTAARMCQAGWVDIRIDGEPYTSCRAQGQAIINLDRWRFSVDHYVSGEVPLDVYRAYVINHEVGHELGHGHERCPGEGEPAPVMMQQTLFLNGCVANPWPFLAGERYAGPPL
ncbi:DUF3152 domain-containing protein [Solwaraspora sp. WMMD937]|uniref:DUF3152 domain-containing protein n=1 Tax=Solwaraspora sp. WMMD937 TaxID=3016090 RepID=UPI00249A9C86|nr:DUF3152 domain-containing protein [Solwaraspora sp. WMMD937]WFE23277.1 DUF3152 domain-containing protein [Solwaraspora sp. WMMD937]